MFKIVFTNVKGGVGKTTLSVLIARAMREAGADVSMLDLDPQKTATHWVQRAEKDTLTVDTPKGFVIVDTRPAAEGVVEAAKAGDFHLLVASPSTADLEATIAAAGLLKQHSKSPVRLIFNMVMKGTFLQKHMSEQAAVIGVDQLKSFVTRRQCYQHAVTYGWKALDKGAKEELSRVATEILSVCFEYKCGTS